MRGLLLAFLAVDVAGLSVGRIRAHARSTKTSAKTTVKTV